MRTLGVIGTGLMGGSIGLACKKKLIFDRCIGYDADSQQLELALDTGCFDGTFSIGESVDAVCVAVPVSTIAHTVKQLRSTYKPDTPIFDLGSVKGSIVEAIDPFPMNYVPCHPIAGSERSGAGASRSDLFENAICVLTPAADTDPNCLTVVRTIWEALGSRVMEISPEEHDKTLGLTSHLPHLVSFAVVEMLCEQSTLTHKLVGNGLRDFTRIAGANGKVWGDIVSANAPVVSEHVERLVDKLQEFVTLARTQPGKLEERFEAISSFRNRIHEHKNSGHRN